MISDEHIARLKADIERYRGFPAGAVSLDELESLIARLEQAEQAAARVRELAENARSTKHESTEYLHPLEVLSALDGESNE